MIATTDNFESLFDRLSDKHQAFVAAYCTNGFNWTQAALEAGYAESTARDQAHRMLRRPDIAAAIKARMAADGITPERITVALANIAFDQTADLADYEPFLQGEATLKELREQGVSTHLLTEASIRPTKYGTTRTVTLESRLAALKELVRVLGMASETVRHEMPVDQVDPEQRDAFEQRLAVARRSLDNDLEDGQAQE